jgi:hypothetical protein
MQFRVAQTSGAAHVAREFDYHSGPLTPEMVNEAGRKAKILDLQKQLRTAYNRHDAKIRANKVELERLTLEAIESGLTDKAQIGKYVGKAIVAGAKHDKHIATLSHELQQQLNLVKVEGASEVTLANANFRQRLLLIKANHTAKGQITHSVSASLSINCPQQRSPCSKNVGISAYIHAKIMTRYLCHGSLCTVDRSNIGRKAFSRTVSSLRVQN